MALADILEWNLNDLPNLIVDSLRDTNSSRLGDLFEANSDVHAGTVKIVLFGDHIPEIHANAELHSLVLRDGDIAFLDFVLNLDSAANGLNNARELGDDAVSCCTEDVALMGGDRLLHNSAVHTQSRR